MYIDLTKAGEVEAEVWSLSMSGNIIHASSMREAVQQVTLYTGRMRSPPEWSQKVGNELLCIWTFFYTCG